MQCTAACFDLITTDGGPTRVRYATAAHPPLLVVSGGTARSVYQPGPFIGVVPDIQLEAVEFEIEPGDRLLAYSDGLEEQWNTDGHEFGLDRVANAIGDRGVDLQRSIDRLVAEWDDFLAGSRPDDDATMIAVENLG